MTLLLALLIAQSTQTSAPKPFQLAPGDYRWVPFTVRQVPTQVDCRFEVLRGDATVHAELLPMSEFRLFSRDREHSTLAFTPEGAKGAFRRIVEERGQYAVVIKNSAGGKPVTVTLDVATDLNPNADVVATELPPHRRLVVILSSFLLFFGMVAFSGFKLIQAFPRKRF